MLNGGYGVPLSMKYCHFGRYSGIVATSQGDVNAEARYAKSYTPKREKGSQIGRPYTLHTQLYATLGIYIAHSNGIAKTFLSEAVVAIATQRSSPIDAARLFC